MTLPYDDTKKDERIYQAWDTDGYNFWKQNFTDVSASLNGANWVSDTFLRLYQQWDGTQRLLGQVTYVPAGPTPGSIDIITLPTNLIEMGEILPDTTVPAILEGGATLVLLRLITIPTTNTVTLTQDGGATVSSGDKVDIDFPFYPGPEFLT